MLQCTIILSRNDSDSLSLPSFCATATLEVLRRTREHDTRRVSAPTSNTDETAATRTTVSAPLPHARRGLQRRWLRLWVVLPPNRISRAADAVRVDSNQVALPRCCHDRMLPMAESTRCRWRGAQRNRRRAPSSSVRNERAVITCGSCNERLWQKESSYHVRKLQ